VGERRLVSLQSFGDAMSADAFVAFLAAHQIEAHVEGADPLSIGLCERVRVVIAEGDVRRARWVLDNADVSDGEAWFLATGQLDSTSAKLAFESRGSRSLQELHPVRRIALLCVAALAIVALLSR
jgi:hypothetical protein